MHARFTITCIEQFVPSDIRFELVSAGLNGLSHQGLALQILMLILDVQ